MAWKPSVIISGGLYEGQGVYDGDLTGLFSYMTNLTANANIIRGLGNYQDQSSWSGAFGIDDGPLREYALQHQDNTIHTFDLMIIDVPNPEGATYYKQQFIVRGYTRCTAETTQTRTIEEDVYTVTFNQILYGIDSIKRAEYLYPYSTPTIEDLGISALAFGSVTLIKNGDKIALATGYRNHIYEKCRLPIGYGVYNNVQYFAVGYYLEDYSVDSSGDVSDTYTRGLVAGLSVAALDNYFGKFVIPEKEDPNDDPHEPGGGHSGEGGGDGDHDKTEDPIPIPDLPSVGAAGAGFITMYRMTQGEIQIFARDLFADPLDPDKAWQQIKNFFSDPLDFMAGVMILPFTPAVNGSDYPQFGLFTWPDAYDVITQQFQEIDCGSHLIPRFYNSAFDQNPYTKVTLWLPFIGYRDLNADEVIGQVIGIKYHVDCLTGDCVCFIYKNIGGVAQQVLAQFSGNCAIRVPFGRQSFDAAIQAGIQLLGGAVGTAVSAGQLYAEGGQAGPTAESLSGIAKSFTVGAVNSMKVNVEKSGIAGASAGYMSIMKPFIIRIIPNQSLPDNYRRLNGYPANLGGTLNQYTGYTAVESIELTGVSATEAEKVEIISLLRGGFII